MMSGWGDGGCFPRGAALIEITPITLCGCHVLYIKTEVNCWVIISGFIKKLSK